MNFQFINSYMLITSWWGGGAQSRCFCLAIMSVGNSFLPKFYQSYLLSMISASEEISWLFSTIKDNRRVWLTYSGKAWEYFSISDPIIPSEMKFNPLLQCLPIIISFLFRPRNPKEKTQVLCFDLWYILTVTMEHGEENASFMKRSQLDWWPLFLPAFLFFLQWFNHPWIGAQRHQAIPGFLPQSFSAYLDFSQWWHYQSHLSYFTQQDWKKI